MQEQVCRSEGNREALNIVAEVGGDPEVRDESIHEDILGREGPTRKKESRWSVSRRSEHNSGCSRKGTRPGRAFGRANSRGEDDACPSRPLSRHAPTLLTTYRRYGGVPSTSRLCPRDPRDGPRALLGSERTVQKRSSVPICGRRPSLPVPPRRRSRKAPVSHCPVQRQVVSVTGVGTAAHLGPRARGPCCLHAVGSDKAGPPRRRALPGPAAASSPSCCRPGCGRTGQWPPRCCSLR